MSAFAACEKLVRRHDPDRFFAALFAPADKRHFLCALYAFNYEVARVAETIHEPMLGEIRLAWWRETVEGARSGAPRNHDVAKALAETFATNDLPQDLFEKMIEARGFDVSPQSFADMAALEAYADATSGSLMRLAALVLGGGSDDLAREAGIAYALSGLLRAIPFHTARDKLYLPTELLDGLTPDDVAAGQGGKKLENAKMKVAQLAKSHLASARKLASPRAAVPAFLPAALVPLYLRRPDAPLWRRQIVFLHAAMRGRV
ncbi:MAG: squalene/phytoene synthase family protein [Alphaproteobacteria bacterium]|nr:squalene/phytoene synthase family protein [Alphaproteobacteria bacterium]